MRDDVGVHVGSEVEAHREAPRASALGSLSGTAGTPAKSEMRTVTCVDGCVACGARVSDGASAEGTNVPVSRPFACAARNPGWTPPFARSKTSRTSRLSFSILGSVVSGMRVSSSGS